MELQKCSLANPYREVLEQSHVYLLGLVDTGGFGSVGYLAFDFWIQLITRRRLKRVLYINIGLLWSLKGQHGWCRWWGYIHERTVRIQTLLGSVTITSEMGEILIWTPCHGPVYFQHPNSCGFELPSPAHIFLLSSPIIHETSWAKLSHSRGALMKSTSLSERVWKNNGGTEIITLHSALGFNTFLIKVILAGWITTVILDALLIKASHAGTEKPLHFIIIFAWDMGRGKRCWKI